MVCCRLVSLNWCKHLFGSVIRIYDLPLMARNVYVGNLICGALGEVFEVDLDRGEMQWGEYMRVQVI